MSVDNPAGLWLLAALPVIVALWLLRPRRPRLRIPSVLLWPSSPAERRSASPWQRLRQHPLLWLQLVLAAVLALAVAQPFLPSEATSQRVIALLDASGSMRATDVSPSRWDAARAAVVSLASSLGPDQTLSVLRLDEQPRVLLADTRDPSAVQAALASETPTYGPIDAATSLSLATGLARGAPSEWVLVGDGEFPAVPAGVGMPSGTHFRFISIGDVSAGNVALTNLSLRATGGGGGAVAGQLGIDNQSDVDASGTIELTNDAGAVVATRAWSAGPRQATYVTWDDIASGARWFSAHLRDVSPAAANALPSDDQAWAVAPSLEAADTQLRALLVSPGNTFLERALTVDSNLRTFKVAPADWPGLLSQGGAASYPLVVLDRQPRDAAPVRGSTLYVGVAGSSGPSDQPQTFRPRLIAPVPDHPLLRNVDWSDVRVGQATRLTADELSGWQIVVDSDGGPLLLTRTVRDNDQVRREALLTFELGESDLPLRSAFPVLMANLLDWLAPRPEGNPRSVAPGATLQLETSPLATALRVESAFDASHSTETLAPPWPPQPFRASAPGVYRATEDDPDGAVTTLIVADAYAATEANITPSQPTVLASQTAQPDAIGQALRGVRAGLWPWLVAGLLALAAAEWIVDSRGR